VNGCAKRNKILVRLLLRHAALIIVITVLQ
jgi:hypothetical protein